MRKILYALLLAVVLVWAGCGGTNINEVSGQLGFYPPPPPAGDGAFLRLAHLSPDAPNVDILVDGERVVTNAPFETFSDYFAVPAGARRIEVRATGAGTEVIDTVVTLAAGGYSTVAAAGRLEDIEALLLVDDVTPTPATLSLRLFHAVPGLGSVRLTDQQGTTLAGPVTFGNATIYNATATQLEGESLQLRRGDTIVATYSTVRGGNENLIATLRNQVSGPGLNLTITAAGEGEELPLIVALDQATAGGTTFVAAPDTVTPSPTPSPTVTPSPTPTPTPKGSVRFSHVYADGVTPPDLDVLVNGEVVLENLTWGEVSDYLPLDSGEREIAVRIAGSRNALVTGTVELTADSFQTVAILAPQTFEVSTQATGQGSLIVFLDDVTPVANQALFRIVHASPGLPPVEVSAKGVEPDSQENPNPETPFDFDIVTTPLAYGQTVVVDEFEVADFRGVRRVQIGNAGAGLSTFISGPSEPPSGPLLDAYTNWSPAEGVNATVYLMGQGPDEYDVGLLIVVDGGDAAGLSIRGNFLFQ